MQRRNTPNKKRILGLFEKTHILTAQEVCQALPKIEVSTVYRNLERFVTDGVLRTVHVEPGSVAYELAGDAHDHFVCDDCNTIEPIHTRKAALASVLPQGAQMHEGGVVVHGMCKECSN